MRRVTATALGALGLLLLPAEALADVRLDVRTDRTSLSLDDTLTVQITVQSEGGGSPDVTLPDFDGFEVVGQEVQRPMQFSFSFGARTTVRASTIYTFQLRPERAGVLMIKPVRAELDGQVKASQPLRITVSAGSGRQPAMPDPNAQADPDDQTQGQTQQPNNNQPQGNVQDNTQFDPVAFIRTVVDNPTPYEGEQVTVTIYLYVRDRLQANPAIKTEPTTDGLWLHDLLPPNRTPDASRQLVGDTVFTAYTLRRFAAFPLHAGDVTIGPLAISIDTSSVFDIFGPRRRQTVERSGLPTVLHVKPLPATNRPAGEIAVGRFQLNAKLDRAQAATGDAVTLTATVTGDGNIRTVQLAPPALPGMEILAPEVKDIVEAPNDLVGGTREYRWLLVARQPGRITIPALTLQTFDPRSGQYHTVSSQPLALEVVGNALPKPVAAAPADTGPDAQPTPDAQEPGDHVWAPIRTQSALRRGYKRLVEQPFYLWAVLAPALLWFALVSGSFVRRRLSSRGETESGRVLRRADAQLRTADEAAQSSDGSRFHAAASAALLDALEARLGEAVSGLTRRQLSGMLTNRGMDDTLRVELLRMLEHCEVARFGAADPGALDSRAAELHELYKRVTAFQPTAEGAA